MKSITAKVLVFVAAAAMSGYAMAEDELKVYGKINVDLQSADEAGESQVELKSNASRFGVKGSTDINESLQAIYQLEWEVDTTDAAKSSEDHIKSRNQYVGLKGSFGTIKAGRHDTALKSSQGKFDQFNDLEGDIKNIVNGENRVSNFVGYTTPKFADAFSVEVNLVPGEDAAAGEDGIADGTSLALVYEANGLYLAVAQDADIDGADVDTTRFTGAYKIGDLQLGLLFQTTDTGIDDADATGLSVAYKAGNGTFKLQYIDSDLYLIGEAALETQSSIGYDYKLGKNSKVYGFYTTGDIGGTEDSNDYFGIGFEQKF